MNTKTCCCVILSLVFALYSLAAEGQTTVDLRRGVPQTAHMVVHGRHNPERDYQLAYLDDICQTVADEQIVERFIEIVTSRAANHEVERARSVWQQLQTALEPAHFDAILQAEDIVYAQVMEFPVNHHLLVLRMTSEDAAGFERAADQLFDLVQEWSDGKVSKIDQQEDETHAILLDLPKEVPLRPALLRIDDIVIISTSEQLARQSAAMLQGDGSDSKFDDPRLVEALALLPEPEDAVFFFDGRLLFERLGGFTDFIRQQNSQRNEKSDEKMERFCRLFELVINELAIIDYEVTVEYTEGQQNRTAVIGKLAADAKDKLLYRAVNQGEPFENWQTWVPADAKAYSLSTGVNLHLIYEWLTQFLRTEIPESQETLDKLEQKQEELDFHLDRDLLQVFSGESVSVTVPVEAADGSTSLRTVTALRCSNSDRIRELINRGIESLVELPPVQAQQLRLVDCEDLEGFQELQAGILPMFGVRPVFGFHEEWMIISFSPKATAKVLAARDDAADSIDQSASFRSFDLEVEGAVCAVYYTDIGAAVEQAAKTIEQIGAIAPMVVGMIAAQADGEDLQPLQEVLSLLPNVAKVVRRFDFLEDKLSVTREGPLEGSYRRDAVVIVKAPSGE